MLRKCEERYKRRRLLMITRIATSITITKAKITTNDDDNNENIPINTQIYMYI